MAPAPLPTDCSTPPVLAGGLHPLCSLRSTGCRVPRPLLPCPLHRTPAARAQALRAACCISAPAAAARCWTSASPRPPRPGAASARSPATRCRCARTEGVLGARGGGGGEGVAGTAGVSAASRAAAAVTVARARRPPAVAAGCCRQPPAHARAYTHPHTRMHAWSDPKLPAVPLCSARRPTCLLPRQVRQWQVSCDLHAAVTCMLQRWLPRPRPTDCSTPPFVPGVLHPLCSLRCTVCRVARHRPPPPTHTHTPNTHKHTHARTHTRTHTQTHSPCPLHRTPAVRAQALRAACCTSAPAAAARCWTSASPRPPRAGAASARSPATRTR
jgi:hypothetical protein